MKRITLITKPQGDYELLDSGGEEKLERFGEVVLSRPDPQALWEKSLPANEWEKAVGKYERDGKEGKWVFKNQNPPAGGWPVEFGGAKFIVKPTSFKHVGLFPEQLSNWEWIQSVLAVAKEVRRGLHRRPAEHMSESSAEDSRTSEGLLLQAPHILNLFGYTGGATLAAAKAGAEVTHVDASKTAVAWARENAEASGLADKPIRWIVEDAMTFVERELKRGKSYDAIIMDPPAFGHGPKNELWKIEEDFLKLMKLCQQLLSEKPLFFLINGYAAGYSPLAFAYNLEFLQKKFGGEIEYGDLAIEQKGTERVLPCGIFARWKRE